MSRSFVKTPVLVWLGDPGAVACLQMLSKPLIHSAVGWGGRVSTADRERLLIYWSCLHHWAWLNSSSTMGFGRVVCVTFRKFTEPSCSYHCSKHQ